LLRALIESRWFALFTLILVIVSGLCLYLWPQSWTWALLLPLVPWVARTVVKPVEFRSPILFASIAIFLVTSVIGYRVAYDEATAWNKFWLLLVAILLYLTILQQPVQNLRLLAGFALLFGVGVASFYLLTADFTTQAVKFGWIHQLGVAWMNVRPDLFVGSSIYSNDAAGLSIITAAFGLPLLGNFGHRQAAGYVQKLIVLAALGVVLLAVVLASSRGGFLGLIGSVGIWFVWRLLPLLPLPSKEKLLGWFPYLVIIAVLALEVVVLFIPSGILGSSFAFNANGNVFVSRAEVFRSGLMILRDFPFTGGGLATFPGLYSQYVLVIPFYSLPHSHNMILNVMIEQGVLGGIAFALIYLISLKRLLSVSNNTSAQLWYLAACISLFTALFHGMVDDYLYETSGPVLSLFPAAMAVLISRLGVAEQTVEFSKLRTVGRASVSSQLRSFLWMPVLILPLVVFWNPIMAQWYANLGAVQMAKVDLANYPADKWSEGENLFQLAGAERNFQRALTLQLDNQTANHRMGLIRMSARDFDSATTYLQIAYDQDTENRGVIKNLGYSYLWFGEIEKAESLLARIPESKHELDVYIWWWNDRRRPDLSDRAAEMAAGLTALP
jgi:O-antigen ligase